MKLGIFSNSQPFYKGETKKIIEILNKNNVRFEIYNSLKKIRCDILIVIGGDGTILKTVRELKKQIPILGVSLEGRFLPEIKFSEFEIALKKLLKGEYEIEEVLKVEVQYKNFKTWGLNDVVVCRDDEQCNRIRIFSEGKDIYGQELIGDGIIASAPSGSTGYNYIADGEVLDKDERKFEVTPLLCSFKGNGFVKGRKILTKVKGGNVFQNGKEVIVRYNRKIRNKIVPDSIQEKRRFFNFEVGDEVIVRNAKGNSKFVKIL
jgi:NAD+ kinase